MSFAEDKRKALRKLAEAMERKEVDEEVIPILTILNSSRNFYTTSSCAGRYQLVEFKFNDSLEMRRIWKKHAKASIEEVLNAVQSFDGYLMLFVEPPIFHVVARDLEAAHKLMHLAREAGFKRTGIRSYKPERIVIEILSTEFLKMPIGKNGVIDYDSLKVGIELGNRLLERGKAKLRRLFELLRSDKNFFA